MLLIFSETNSYIRQSNSSLFSLTMFKSTITNNTYRNILFAFLALSVLLQLLAVLNGDFSFIPSVSMLANFVVLLLFFRSDEHLKLSVQVAAALPKVNSVVSLYSKGHFIELLA